MGAWGHGSFSNDAALDWLAELRGGDPDLFGEALDRIVAAEDDVYLDVDDCSAALAAAEIVAARHEHGEPSSAFSRSQSSVRCGARTQTPNGTTAFENS